MNTAQIVDLVTEFVAAESAYSRAKTDTEGSAIVGHQEEILETLASLRATSVAELAAKLRVFKVELQSGDTDLTDALFESIVADAERLAGGVS